MTTKQKKLWQHFIAILGELSIKEIMANKEMIKRAELVHVLFFKYIH